MQRLGAKAFWQSLKWLCKNAPSHGRERLLFASVSIAMATFAAFAGLELIRLHQAANMENSGRTSGVEGLVGAPDSRCLKQADGRL